MSMSIETNVDVVEDEGGAVYEDEVSTFSDDEDGDSLTLREFARELEGGFDDDVSDFSGHGDDEDVEPEAEAVPIRQRRERRQRPQEEEQESGYEAQDNTEEELPVPNHIAARLRTAERDRKVLEARLNQTLSAMQMQQAYLEQQLHGGQAPEGADAGEPEDDEIPDLIENPVGNLASQLSKVRSMLEEQRKKEERERAEQSQRSQVDAMTQRALDVSRKAHEFRDSLENPQEYIEAATFLRESLHQEAILLHPDLTTDQAGLLVTRQMVDRMVDWDNRGINPGEGVVALSYARGYRPGTARAQAPAAQPKPAAKPAQGPPRPSRKQGTGTLSSLSSGNPPQQITAKRALAMSEDDYEAMMDGENRKWTDLVKQFGVPSQF